MPANAFSEVVREPHVVDREAVNVKSVLVEDWFSQGFGGGLVLVLSIAVLVLVLDSILRYPERDDSC